MKLSILVPVYNERAVVERSLDQVLNAPLPETMSREVIVVDDCSSDGTLAILERLAAAHPEIVLVRHAVNQGKGAAIRTAIQHASGDFSIIQDADLEYDPQEYSRLLQPLLEGRADAVFGSRYMAGEQRRVLPFWHSRVNAFLTAVSNMFSNLALTDMETCYKVFRTDLLKSIPIRSNRFGIEPELAMKCSKRKLRIYEVPISYHGRSYEEGKKIGWRDGLNAFSVILKFWLIDDLYTHPYGWAYLNNMTGTPKYLNWIAELLRPYLGDRVLELGAGIGGFSGLLMGRRIKYVAAETDPLYLHALRNRFLRTPNVEVRQLDEDDPGHIMSLGQQFDSVLCLNRLEYLRDPARTLDALRHVLLPDGRLMILAPYDPSLTGTLDQTLSIQRRFSEQDLQVMLTAAGFVIEKTIVLNRMGAAAWRFFGKVLRRRHINKVTLKLFDTTVWLWRRIDSILPWNGLSIVIIARRY